MGVGKVATVNVEISCGHCSDEGDEIAELGVGKEGGAVVVVGMEEVGEKRGWGVRSGGCEIGFGGLACEIDDATKGAHGGGRVGKGRGKRGK